MEEGRPPATVAVVMPVHNGRPYVRLAAESVLLQTHRDLELIVVDDGSTDDGVDELPDDPRVRLIRQAASGVAHARNRGLEEVSPAVEFVAFIDHDDLWMPNKLATQLQWFDDPDVVAVGSLMSYIDTDGRQLGVTGQSPSTIPQGEVAAARLMPFPPSSMVARASAIQAAGGFDDTLPLGLGFHLVCDLDFIARIARVGRVEIVNEVLGSYRISRSAASATSARQMHIATRFLEARFAGETIKDLDPISFARSYRMSWRERREFLGHVNYRSAGLAVAERRYGIAAARALVAALLTPRYVVSRWRAQRRLAPATAVDTPSV